MEQKDVVTRVVAVLTETADWVRDDSADAGGDDVVNDLIGELLSTEVSISADATPREVAEALSDAMRPKVSQVLAAFAGAFHRLAIEHDRLDPEVTSADVLQQMALNSQRS